MYQKLFPTRLKKLTQHHSCMVLEVHKEYDKPKPISCQNRKLTQQHNWKKGSSSPRVASVFVSLSGICLLYTYTYVEMSHQLFILFLHEKNIEKKLIWICDFEFSKSNTGRRFSETIPISL
jgi:hypothetical protein